MATVTIDEHHVYRLDGVVKPGFSEIKESYGIGVNPFYTDAGRDEGTALHKWLLFLAQGQEPASEPDYRIAGRVKAIKRFLKETGFKIRGGEKPLHSTRGDFCCTPDLWGDFQGVQSLFEAKRGAKESWHPLQTAAQSIALWANGFAVGTRYNLYLRDDGTYRIDPHKNTSDEYDWLTLAAAWHVKRKYQKGGRKNG
jgi:hypothetical protein